MNASARRVVTRSPARTVMLVNLPALLPHPVEAESSYERDFIRLAALYVGTRAIAHQPFRLSLAAGNYTPDFLVTFADGSKVVVEVKPQAKVEQHQQLFAEAADTLAERGLSFLVATERELRRERVNDRARLLLRYAKGQPAPSDLERVLQMFVEQPTGLPLGTLTKRARVTRETIFHLIAHRHLTTGRRLLLDDAVVVKTTTQTKETTNAVQFAIWIGAALWS
ncbi:TnsA endonuclease N-terminal domain-containing protein [Caldimonas sp. KR1-144]|uniref:TnsA endonuclease N-terminal domain-containing protein n=1 Tax=Caldimonas sp. KR1-144 TaxID=3400911 RepID=UPI003C05736D